MNQDWQRVKLGEICEIRTGKKDVNYSTPDGQYTFFTCAAETYLAPDYSFEGEAILLPGNGANVGKVYYFKGRFEVYQRTYVLQKFPDNVYSRYLYYFLSFDWKKYISNKQFGSATNYIVYNSIFEIEIPLPPLPEQQRIVALLDQAFAAIAAARANAEKNLQNARELYKNIISSTFIEHNQEWGLRIIENICENLDSKRKPVTKRDRISGSYPYYGASGIVDYVNEYIYDENLLLVSEDGANLLARTYPIAFSVKGKIWVNNHAHVLRFKELITQRFVEFYLNSIPLDIYVNGMAQPKLNQTMLNSIPIPLPNLCEQKKVVEKFEAITLHTNQLEEKYKKIIVDLDELKQSLLQKAFSGEL